MWTFEQSRWNGGNSKFDAVDSSFRAELHSILGLLIGKAGLVQMELACYDIWSLDGLE